LLQAQLKGKLVAEEERMEDILTSNVFGSIKYLKPEEGLLPILQSVIDINGQRPFSSIREIYDVHFSFWPWLRENECKPCEPDVLITVRLPDHRKIILLVEAKYLSEKSSEADENPAPNDQLAREYDNLEKLAGSGDILVLLYVTAHFGYPKEDIEESMSEHHRKRRSKMSVYWISWRKIASLYPNAKEDTILYDLVMVLRRMGLTFYEGLTVSRVPKLTWKFKAVTSWTWTQYDFHPLSWNFAANQNFNWQHSVTPFKWRFDNER